MKDFFKICGCFSALFLLARLNDFSANRKRAVDTNQIAVAKYHENTVRIHMHLFEINRLSAHGKVAEANNIFWDVVHLWYARDVMVMPYKIQNSTLEYFPSDSLVKLKTFLFLKLMDEQNSADHVFSIAQEIKRIQGLMDECDESSFQRCK